MTTRPVGRDRHRSPRSLRRWLLGNGFLLVLPVLVWDVLLAANLPAAYQQTQVSSGTPWLLATGESVTRWLVILIPVMMRHRR